MRPHYRPKFLMSRVGKICIAVRFVSEGNPKTVREPLGLSFHANIGPPFKIIYGIYLVRKRAKRILDFFQPLWACIILEFKKTT